MSRPTSNDRSKIIPFSTDGKPPTDHLSANPQLSTGTLKAEDDPEEWIYPEETKEEADLRQLVEEMTQLDAQLTGLLVDMATGEVPTSELVSKLDDWQKSMGADRGAAPTQPPEPRPWLV